MGDQNPEVMDLNPTEVKELFQHLFNTLLNQMFSTFKQVIQHFSVKNVEGLFKSL